VGGTTLSAGWVANRQDRTFAGNFPNGLWTSALFNVVGYNKFSGREMFFGGLMQRFGAATRVSANVWRTLQSGKVASGDGNATQFQLLADYGLSKRTVVYAEADYSLYRGGLIGAQLQGLPAQPSAASSTQPGISVGLRHQF
jgi:predicted porin